MPLPPPCWTVSIVACDATGAIVDAMAEMPGNRDATEETACSMLRWYHRAMPRRRARLAPNPHKLELKATMLDELWEAAGVDDIEEWFRAPWSDGRHAIELCFAACAKVSDDNLTQRSQRAKIETLAQMPRNVLTTVEYDRVDAVRYEASRSPDRTDVLIEAAASILMNWIANSDGGGHVANVHLAGAFWPLLRDNTLDENVARELVGFHRARDLGLVFHDVEPRGRLFRWLWLNSRYRMAMTIGADRA